MPPESSSNLARAAGPILSRLGLAAVEAGPAVLRFVAVQAFRFVHHLLNIFSVVLTALFVVAGIGAALVLGQPRWSLAFLATAFVLYLAKRTLNHFHSRITD